MNELCERFLEALHSAYGPRKLSAALGLIADLIWKARADVSWAQIAHALSHALEAEGEKPITADTLRGMMGRKRRIARAATSTVKLECSPPAPAPVLGSRAGVEPTSAAAPSLGRIEQVALRRARISALDRKTN